MNLFAQTGSSRINFATLYNFNTFFDEEKQLHPPTIDFCAYAIKQLVGINEMWWILYFFCPCFVDDRTMAFSGQKLRYLIVKYVLLPMSSEKDHAVVQVDDLYGAVDKAIQHLKQFKDLNLIDFDRDVTWCSLPKIDMRLSQEKEKTKTLSVTYLPLSIAMIYRDTPPPFGYFRSAMCKYLPA